jgi:hypothetical protein
MFQYAASFVTGCLAVGLFAAAAGELILSTGVFPVPFMVIVGLLCAFISITVLLIIIRDKLVGIERKMER